MAEDPDTRPPFLSRWRNVYLFGVVELALLVAAVWVLTRWAA